MTSSALPSKLSKPARNILHPTDFTKQSDVALAHALKLALTNSAEVHLLHIGEDTREEWHKFPSIREFLQRWGVIAEGSSRSAVTELGIGVEKVIGASSNVPEAIEGYCHRHPIDMIVLATAGRDGVAAWLRPSNAERIAEKVSQLSIPTLFVPKGRHGCVDVDSGEVSMDHVLVPVDHQPDSGSAVERGLRAISMFGSDHAKLTLMHIGSASSFPHVPIPAGEWNVERVVRRGNPAAEIVAAANEGRANAVIMVTEGTDGFLDVLRGTTTSQVLRQAPCPVLAIPAD